MKTTHYHIAALRTLRQHPTLAAHLRETIESHAAAPTRPTTRLAHSPASRLRLGDHRVIFEARETELVVTKIGRRGDVYV